jgi:hypothetical protein
MQKIVNNFSTRWMFSLLLVPILLTVNLGGAAWAAAAEMPRVVWVWEEDTFNILDQENNWNETFDYLARWKLTTVYLYTDSYKGRNIVRDEPEKYRRLIAAAHKRDLKVYALLGSFYLKTQEYILPERRVDAEAMFSNVLRYNAGSASAERFDGVNVDIEPYLLDDWSDKKTIRATQYLELSAEFMRLKSQAGDTLTVGPAMPFWFDGIDDIVWNGQHKRLSDHVQDIYDYVAIMDYRNFAQGSDGIISHATDELDYADATSKKVIIGVETLQTEPSKVTFYGMGYSAMNEQLMIAEKNFLSHSSFAGFSIHHFGSYRIMTGFKP